MAGKKKSVEKSTTNEVVLSTEAFKAMVSKAYRGVGNNKLLPLTQLMCIQIKDDVLTLLVSDATGTNYFYVKQSGVEGDFYATVMADQFAKLIGKFTCDKITLSVDDGKMKVTGNGNYTLALQYDEMGNPIQYPDPVSELGKKEGKTQKLSSTLINKILSAVKPSLALTMENPYLTNYYLGDIIAATNEDEMGIMNNKVVSTPTLIAPIVFELVALSESNDIDIDRYADGVIVVSTPDEVIYSHEMEGIEDYPVDALKTFFESNMPAKCKLPKNELLQTLDRISLFVGIYDENAVNLEFTGKALKISSLAMTGVESVQYISGDDVPFKCSADLMSLIKHIKTQCTDEVSIQFGDSQAIKFVDGDTVQVVSLFEDTSETEDAE